MKASQKRFVRKVQKGFTLIELMIVVAIIGILAAIAIPAYQDYTARAQASEALTLMGGLKTPMAEFIAQTGDAPADITDLGGTTAGKYVDSIAVDSTGTAAGGDLVVTLTSTFKASGVSPDLTSKTVDMAWSQATGGWTCGPTLIAASAATAVDEKFLPASCRDASAAAAPAPAPAPAP